MKNLKESKVPNAQDNFERIERFNTLENGAYWKAGSDYKDLISTDEILMISQIDLVDDCPHTIHVRLHPSKLGKSYRTNVRFLIEDFLSTFEFIEAADAKASREMDIQRIQERIKESQDELTSAFSDQGLMDRLIEHEMPKETVEGDASLPIKLETFGADIVQAVKTQNVSALMSKGLTSTGVEQIKAGLNEQKDIAIRRSEWITKRTKTLSRMAEEMTPYFEEQAALAIAMTKDMMDHVDGLMKGIGSLNLYVLKDVEIDVLCSGQSAPFEEKLSITQSVLYMDEELAVFEEVDDQFDCNDRAQFFEAIGKHQGLINQIFPTTRCVVSIAATRSRHDYSNYSPMYAEKLKKENNTQFLLIRDGGNVYAVLSPENFHRFSKTLFPTTSEQDAPFRGYDGREITYRDLDYTESLKAHERIALGYKRLLILLCGLDHNKRIFGEFYSGEPSLNFVSLRFQHDHFNFICDVGGEGMLPTNQSTSMAEWIDSINSEIGSGSHIVFQWKKVFDRNVIPSAYERENRWNTYQNNTPSLLYKPDTSNGFVAGIVKTSKGKLSLDIEVSGKNNNFENRTFNARLDLSLALYESDRFDILCLDRLNPTDALWYLHDRSSRKLNVSGIRLIKWAIQESEKIRVKEKPLRDRLTSDVELSGLFDDEQVAQRCIDSAIAKWRCAYPRKDILTLLEDSKGYNLLADQVFFMSGNGRDVQFEILAAEEVLGRTPLRISLASNGKYIAYSSALNEEKDDRLIPFYWVTKTFYRIKKKGVSSSKPTFTLLEKFNNSETILFESNCIEEFLKPSELPFKTPSAKVKFLENVDKKSISYCQLLEAKGDVDRISELLISYAAERQVFNKKRNTVLEPYANVFVGACCNKSEITRISFTAESYIVLAWLCSGVNELENAFVEIVSGIYANKEHGERKARIALETVKGELLYDLMQFVLIDPKSKFSLFSKDNLWITRLGGVDGYNYSFSKRIDSLKSAGRGVFLMPEFCGDLDSFLGIKTPENHFPCYVIKEGGFDNKRASITPIESSIKARYRNAKAFDNLEEAKQSLDDVGSHVSVIEKKHFKINYKPVEVQPREINGVVSHHSYEYQEYSREEVDSLFG